MTERIVWPGVVDSVHHTTTTDQDVSDGTGIWSVKKAFGIDNLEVTGLSDRP
jgi:hypothetical protein